MSGPDLDAIDVLLGQGTPEELARARRAIAEDPLRAVEFAETVDLIERLRTVRTEPSARYAARLLDVERRAERRLPPAPLRGRWILAAAAALLGFCTAAWMQDRNGGPREDLVTVALPVLREDGLVTRRLAARDTRVASMLPTTAELERSETLAAMRQRFRIESADAMSTALEEAEHAERNPLDRWIDSHNQLALRRLDHELRTRPEIRLEALRRGGAMLEADERVQFLADDIAARLESLGKDPAARPRVRELALATRALVGAGVTTGLRRRAMDAAASRLGESLPTLRDSDRVLALAALLEVAAVDSRRNGAVAEGGRALLASVLAPGGETWQRGRPFLLGHRVDNHVLGDAGYVLSFLPAFGVEADRCALVRHLLLGELRERRANLGEAPDLLAAMLYGFGDMLGDRDRAEIMLQLRRWKPIRLAPDFVTVQQLAWGVEPGRVGYTRLRLELRPLCVLPAPPDLAGKAALCMTLATDYAARRAGSLATLGGG